MNANDGFYARDARVDAAAVAPLPNSRKVYVEASRPDIRVPMREIARRHAGYVRRALRAQRDHHARDGIHRHPRKPATMTC